MQALRTLIRRHRLLAAMLVVLALSLKAALPAGYMLGQHGQTLTVEICADASGGAVTKEILVPRTGAPAEQAGAHEKAAAPCAYSALGFAALPGADALLLGLALVFILTLGFAPAPSAPLRRVPFLRPPLRGPPALA